MIQEQGEAVHPCLAGSQTNWTGGKFQVLFFCCIRDRSAMFVTNTGLPSEEMCMYIVLYTIFRLLGYFGLSLQVEGQHEIQVDSCVWKQMLGFCSRFSVCIII